MSGLLVDIFLTGDNTFSILLLLFLTISLLFIALPAFGIYLRFNSRLNYIPTIYILQLTF